MSNVHVFENVGYLCKATNEKILLDRVLSGYNEFQESNVNTYVPYLIRDNQKQNYEIGLGKLFKDTSYYIIREKVISSSNDNKEINITDGQFFIFANEYNFNTAFNNVIVKNSDFDVENIRAIYIVDTSEQHVSAQLPDPKENPSLVVDFKNINNSLGKVKIYYKNSLLHTIEGLNKYATFASTGQDWVILQDNNNIQLKSFSAASASEFSAQSDPGGDTGELQYKLDGTTFDGANVFFGNDNKLLFGDSIESQANTILPTSGDNDVVFNQQYNDSNFSIYGSGENKNILFDSAGGLGVNVPDHLDNPTSGNIIFYGEDFVNAGTSGVKNLFFTYDGRLGLNIPTGTEPYTLAHFVNYNCVEGLRIENRTTCNSANITLYHKPPTVNVPANTDAATISLSSKDSNGNKKEYARIIGRVLDYSSDSLKGAYVVAVGSGSNLLQTFVSNADQTFISAGTSRMQVANNEASISSENIVFSGNEISFANLDGSSGVITAANINVQDTISVNNLELSNFANRSILTIDEGQVVAASTGNLISIIGAPSGRLLRTDASGIIATDINVNDLFRTNNDIVYSVYPKRRAEACLSQIIFDAEDLPNIEEFSAGDQISIEYGDGSFAYTYVTSVSANASDEILVMFTSDQITPSTESNLLIRSISKGFLLTLQAYVDENISGDNDSTSTVFSVRPGTNTEFNTLKKPIGFIVNTDSEIAGLEIRPSVIQRNAVNVGSYNVYATNSDIIPLQVIINSVGAGASSRFNTANYDYAARGKWDGLVSDVGTNGVSSFYGTYDQNGNVAEWIASDDIEHRSTENRYVAGGSFTTSSEDFNAFELLNSTGVASGVGFRVASSYGLVDISNITGVLDFEFVPINNPKNKAKEDSIINVYDRDSDSYSEVSVDALGRVPYSFRMGTKEVTNAQYAAFLNSVATGVDNLGLYHEMMGSDDTGGITKAGSSPMSYSIKTNFDNKPVNFVSYMSSLRFCNWLHNNAPITLEEDNPTSITESGAYNIESSVDGTYSIVKNNFSNYYIPTLNEWYKSAYFEPSEQVLNSSNSVLINIDEPVASSILTVGGDTHIEGNLTVSGSFSAQNLKIANEQGDDLISVYDSTDPEVTIQAVNSLALVNSENGRLTIGPNPTLVIDDGDYAGSYRTGFAKDKVTIAADGPIKILSSEHVIFSGIDVAEIKVKDITVVDDNGQAEEFFTGPSGGMLYKVGSAKARASENFIYDEVESAFQLTESGINGLSPLYTNNLGYLKSYDNLLYSEDNILCKTLLRIQDRDGLQIGENSEALKGAILVHQGSGPLAFELNNYLEADGLVYNRYPKRLVYVDVAAKSVTFVQPIDSIGGIASELPAIEELDEEYKFGDTVAIMHTGDFEVEYVKLADTVIGPFDGPDELLISHPPIFDQAGSTIYSHVCPTILPNGDDGGESQPGFTGIMYSITRASTLTNGLGYGLFPQDPPATSGFECDSTEILVNNENAPFTFRPSSKNVISTRPMEHTHFNAVGENIDFAIYGRTKFQYNRYYPDIHDPNPLDGSLPNGLTPVFRVDANIPNAVSGTASGVIYSGYIDFENTVPTGFDLDEIGKVLINRNSPYVINNITKSEESYPSGYTTLDYLADLSVNGYTYSSGIVTDHIYLSGMHESKYIPGAALTVDVNGRIISINPDVPPGPPGPPRSVNAIPGNSSVDLSWLVPVDNGNTPIVDYIIQYSTNNGVTWTDFEDPVSRDTYRQITGLVNDANYVFRVAAVNGIGQGQWSLPSNQATPSSNFPGPIRDLELIREPVGNGEVDKITVNWTPPVSAGNSPIDRYIVKYKKTEDSTFVEIPVSVDSIINGTYSIFINGIDPGPQYTIQVLARNNYGEGVPVTATIDGTDEPPAEPPQPPDKYDFGTLTFNGVCQ